MNTAAPLLKYISGKWKVKWLFFLMTFCSPTMQKNMNNIFFIGRGIALGGRTAVDQTPPAHVPHKQSSLGNNLLLPDSLQRLTHWRLVWLFSTCFVVTTAYLPYPFTLLFPSLTPQDLRRANTDRQLMSFSQRGSCVTSGCLRVA